MEMMFLPGYLFLWRWPCKGVKGLAPEQVALKACLANMADLEEVHLVLFAKSDLDMYKEVLKECMEAGQLVPLTPEPSEEETPDTERKVPHETGCQTS